MTRPSDAGAELSAALLRDLQDAIGEAGSALARRMGLSATDASAIEHISLSASLLSPGELGERLAVTRSSTTEIVDRLVRAGHVERVRDESDRRRFRLVPTESATGRVRSELTPLVTAIDGAADGLGPAEREIVAAYLGRVVEAYRAFARDEDDGRSGG
jgi:DNA-binding MarR family transcriptional regulator